MSQYAKLKVKFPKTGYNLSSLKHDLLRCGCEFEVTGVFLSLIIDGREIHPPDDFVPKKGVKR